MRVEQARTWSAWGLDVDFNVPGRGPLKEVVGVARPFVIVEGNIDTPLQ